MNRIAGSFTLLLAGLGGCVSVTAPPNQGEVKNMPTAKQLQARVAPAAGKPLPPPAIPAAPAATAPPSSMWTGMADPLAGKRPLVDHTASRPLAAEATAPMPGMKPAPLPGLAAVPDTPPDPPLVPPPSDKLASAVQQLRHTPTDSPREAAEMVPSGKPDTVPVATTSKNGRPGVEPQTAAAPSKASKPLVRAVNTKRITLNFEIKDIGPSGLSSVELWYTQDGKDWKKYDAPVQAQLYVVEVDEEGTYGFTLLARSGNGLAKEPPRPGDQPQVWVMVDLSKPEVQLGEIVASSRAGQQLVTINWKASDKNLGRQPITLSCADKEEGPWKVIAAGLDNSGSYNWEVPRGMTTRSLFRVEATDLAGNVGRATSARTLLADSTPPSAWIVNVEANSSQ